MLSELNIDAPSYSLGSGDALLLRSNEDDTDNAVDPPENQSGSGTVMGDDCKQDYEALDPPENQPGRNE